MANLLRAAGSFAIVLVVYWTYALTAVPLIEPSLAAKGASGISVEQERGAQRQTNRQLEELAVLFPPGTLQIEQPKIFQGDRVKLLVGEYEPDNEQGNVELMPCAIVFLPELKEGMTADEQIRQAVVLEAPQGAVLRFDKSSNLSRGKIGRLEGGWFRGPITIRSAGKTDAPDDDLWVVTRDVNLTEERIATRHRVEFRQGPHFGSGRGMVIRLLPGDDVNSSKKGRGPNVAGIESFELAHLDRLSLRLPSDSTSLDSIGASPAPDVSISDPPAEGSDGISDGTLVEVTCDGPFRFHAVNRKATFEKRVVVTAIRAPGKPPARMENCDLLTIHFTERRKAQADAKQTASRVRKKKPSDMTNLQPSLLVAKGNPVVFRAPAEQVEGRAEVLKYDVIHEDMELAGEKPVYVRHGSREIEARHLRYWSPEPPWRFGRVAAAGPGWIRAELDDKPGELLEARWNEELLFRPYERNQVVSLTGGAALSHSKVGNLSAGEIHFRFFELPPNQESRRARLRPDRMSAETDVRLNSPRVSAMVEELGVWFETPTDIVAGPLESGTGPAPAQTTAETVAGASDGARQPASEPTSERHFRVTARKLHARIVLAEPKAELAELTIEDHVELVETRSARPDDKPIVVRGESIHVKDASKPHATLGLKGNPATYEGQGLALSGKTINVNQGTNELTVPGAGWMNLPSMKQLDLNGQPMGETGPVHVRWQEGMVFDGRTARFKGKVSASSRLRQLSADTLNVTLDRMIRFAEIEQLKGQEKPKVQEFHCEGRGGVGTVWMESRSFKDEQQDSYSYIEARNLILNAASGALTAGGPGYVRSVSRSSGELGELSGLSSLRKKDETVDETKEKPLTYLHVRFSGGIRGNVHRREMTFHDQVHTVYGPVDAWDQMIAENDPDAWGTDGGQMSTDQLTVREMPSPNNPKETMRELEAIGNTRIEGQEYAAFCTRLCYDQSKGVILLQGDGRNKATLRRQERVGEFQDTASAEWFRYWPKTKRVQSRGVGSVEMRQSAGRGPYSR